VKDGASSVAIDERHLIRATTLKCDTCQLQGFNRQINQLNMTLLFHPWQNTMPLSRSRNDTILKSGYEANDLGNLAGEFRWIDRALAQCNLVQMHLVHLNMAAELCNLQIRRRRRRRKEKGGKKRTLEVALGWRGEGNGKLVWGHARNPEVVSATVDAISLQRRSYHQCSLLRFGLTITNFYRPPQSHLEGSGLHSGVFALLGFIGFNPRGEATYTPQNLEKSNCRQLAS